MKILMLNKYFYIRGGSERYFFELSRLLEAAGHEVIFFSMHDERNLPSEYARWFVPNVEYAGRMSVREKLRAAARTIYYPQARRNVEQMIEQFRPDIVHAHNIYHQLSYSPLHAAHRHGIPVVLTAHDYKLICPSIQLFCQGKTCERCTGRWRFHNALLRCCGKGFSGSLVLTLESYFNRVLYDVVRSIDVIITPSRFMREKFLEHGLPAHKVVQLYNPLDTAQYEPHFGGQDYALYLGRLTTEKGVRTLMQALARLPQTRLKIAGEGPEDAALRSQAATLGLRQVEFLGYQSGDALRKTVQNASVVVVPSEWHENFPYAILEAFAYGKPVIGSRVGGIPELIEGGQTGWLFDVGNEAKLAARIDQALKNPAQCEEAGRRAREKVESMADPAAHLGQLTEIYRNLIQKG